jgi:membrane-associated phospholipid phosphatase
MFNTQVNHFFQQFDHPVIYWFLAFISILGMAPVMMMAVCTVVFGINFRKGIVLINLVALTAFVTDILKHEFDYPRPIDIDHSLKDRVFTKTEKDLFDLQPTGFYDSFSTELLDVTRNDEYERHGFPSGHTAIQLTFWTGLLFLFRRKWILITGITVVLLTMLSRLYLAHHFLGDVLGGVVVGGTISALYIFYINKIRYFDKITHDTFSLSFLYLPWLVFPFAPYIPYWQIASVIGVNMVALLIILYRNFPVYHVIIEKRFMACLIAIILFLSAFYLNKLLIYAEQAHLNFLIIIVMNFAAIWGALSLNRRLHLLRYRF